MKTYWAVLEKDKTTLTKHKNISTKEKGLVFASHTQDNYGVFVIGSTLGTSVVVEMHEYIDLAINQDIYLLKDKYNITDFPQIYNFLYNKRELIGFIKTIPNIISEYIEDSKLSLEVVKYSDSDLEQLLIFVSTQLSNEEAHCKLNDFLEKYWFLQPYNHLYFVHIMLAY